MQTMRKIWRPFRGRVTLNYNWDAIDQDSVVVVTVSECSPDGVRFVGAATISADNIAPHGPPYDPNHGVTFVVNVDWPEPLRIVTDITVLDAKPVDVQFYEPDVSHNLGMRTQYQQSAQWCWIATAVSVDRFYDPASTWTQCQVMTQIGQSINGFPTNTSACPTASALRANPALATRIADPYDISSRYVMDDPALGVNPLYLKSGGVTDALRQTNNLASWQGPNVTLSQLTQEINAGRPVIAGIKWSSGSSHYVTIAGVNGEAMLVLDPVLGQSLTEFGDFPGTYFGGATLVGYAFTRP